MRLEGGPGGGDQLRFRPVPLRLNNTTMRVLAGLCRLAVVCLLLACPSMAGALTAAADDQALWLLVPTSDQAETFTVLHHAMRDPPDTIDMVQTLNGDIRPHSIAARDHMLWLIYAKGQVQSIHAKPYVLEGLWEYQSQNEPGLPKGVAVRATAVTAEGLWVLVRVEHPDVLDALTGVDDLQSQQVNDPIAAKRRRNIALGLPPDLGVDPGVEQVEQAPEPVGVEDDKADAREAGEPTTTDDATGPEQPAAQPVDRLLHLSSGRWYSHPLPDNWPHGARAWMVVQGRDASCPTLIALGSDSVNRRHVQLHVYESRTDQDDATWHFQPYAIDGSNGVDLAFASAESQLIAAVIRAGKQGVSADLSLLRSGKTFHVGRMTLPGVTPNHAALLGADNAVTWLGRTGDALKAPPGSAESLATIWTRMDVRGRTLVKPTTLAVNMPSPMDHVAQYIVLGFIVLLVLMLVLAFWRRDAQWNKLELPDDRVVADLPRRALAAMIDMAPGLVGSMLYFQLSFNGLMLRWPGNGIAQTLEQVAPGSIVIAVFVTHTTLSELVFSRTLGKTLIGLRTTTLNGQRPKAWQLLVRGLLKILDLTPGAWLLLILPAISPHRQRLGDIIARTVVTCQAPPPPEGSDNRNPEQ